MNIVKPTVRAITTPRAGGQRDAGGAYCFHTLFVLFASTPLVASTSAIRATR
jgi:hypothetical protein